jgi:hypothetical protein
LRLRCARGLSEWVKREWRDVRCGLGETLFGGSRRLYWAPLNKAKSVISVVYATITVGGARPEPKPQPELGWGFGCAYLAVSSSEPLSRRSSARRSDTHIADDLSNETYLNIHR